MGRRSSESKQAASQHIIAVENKTPSHLYACFAIELKVLSNLCLKRSFWPLNPRHNAADSCLKSALLNLQNKLHRNAGPEDLVATEAMLERISNDGGYNQDFVREFRVFTAELRDFFNAGSFADMLQGLQAALDDQEQQASSA